MADMEEALVRCFTAVFPSLSRDEILGASTESVAEWDSLSALTLVAVVEEQFGVVIDDLDLPELGSFPALRQYLKVRVPS